MANNDEKKDEIEIRTISVKGVSSDIYKKIHKIAMETGKTIGQITDEAYKNFISSVENARTISQSFMDGLKQGSSQYIENIKELEISKVDLEELNRKVIFRNIDNLTLKDLDNDSFDRYVSGIIQVKNLNIPKKLSKAKVIVKCNFVDKINVIG
ncbi:hypothetical protein [Picrophilus oshimae]|uniref:Uncharacterized protein n=1 Tax=Picrophilus torridus (strain ATCC 700027 / DSM 9790 / JCM 10055 / NBRC 100828 / KAW 2/3) TaxID=1122961 RepID=Q6KZJ2_PICTO|nr:hypothetical protein [Picrophilus oshimae]AAT43860.1 hypothetical protein PTO1275 [Picrophilus oshimae DSM 9789]SMD31071.1 hypothetical protein SAMN02745355_0990 [Picrophilus oshimae DSM 9789]